MTVVLAVMAMTQIFGGKPYAPALPQASVGVQQTQQGYANVVSVPDATRTPVPAPTTTNTPLPTLDPLATFVGRASTDTPTPVPSPSSTATPTASAPAETSSPPRFSFPTFTPTPDEMAVLAERDRATRPTTPADSGNEGPQRLVLWTGEELPVYPASGTMVDGVWTWELAETPDRAAWHTDTRDCGRGVTVIGGHSAWGREGPLMALNRIGENDEVVCYDAAGQPHRFAPVDHLIGDRGNPIHWHPGWPEATLILYTCRPGFEKQIVVRFKEVQR